MEELINKSKDIVYAYRLPLTLGFAVIAFCCFYPTNILLFFEIIIDYLEGDIYITYEDFPNISDLLIIIVTAYFSFKLWKTAQKSNEINENIINYQKSISDANEKTASETMRLYYLATEEKIMDAYDFIDKKITSGEKRQLTMSEIIKWLYGITNENEHVIYACKKYNAHVEDIIKIKNNIDYLNRLINSISSSINNKDSQGVGITAEEIKSALEDLKVEIEKIKSKTSFS